MAVHTIWFAKNFSYFTLRVSNIYMLCSLCLYGFLFFFSIILVSLFLLQQQLLLLPLSFSILHQQPVYPVSFLKNFSRKFSCIIR